MNMAKSTQKYTFLQMILENQEGDIVGGYGSTRWDNHYRKCTTVECMALPIKDVVKSNGKDNLSNVCKIYGSYSWHNTRTKEPTGNIGYVLSVPSDGDAPVMILDYMYTDWQGNKTDINTTVDFDVMPMRFGGVRYWFKCPNCNRRCGVIYLPPGQKYFACRICYNLTYKSTQEAHSHDRGRFAGLWVAVDLNDRKYELLKKLWRCRDGSKRAQHLRRQIDKINAKIQVADMLANRTLKKLDIEREKLFTSLADE